MSIFQRLRQRLSTFQRGGLFYGVYWGVVGLYQPYMFVYFSSLGFSKAQIGMLSSVLSLCVMISTPMFSRLADRLNRRTTVMAGLVLVYATLLTIFPIAKTFQSILPMFLLMSIFYTPIAPIGDSLVVRMASGGKASFGGMRLWGSLVFAVTTAVFGIIWQKTGFQPMFYIGAGLMATCTTFAVLLLDEPRPAEDTSPTRATAHMQEATPAAASSLPRMLLSDTPMLFLLCALILVGSAFSIVWTFDTLFVTSLGVGNSMIGYMRGISALVEFPPMLFSGWILRRIGHMRAFLLSVFLLALSFFGYALANSAASILFVNVIKGLGYGLFFIAMVVIVDKRAPRGFSSTYQGITSAAAFGLAPAISAPLGGWLYDLISPRSLFVITGVIMLLSMLVIIPAFKVQSPAEQQHA